MSDVNPVTPDQALIKHLERQERLSSSINGTPLATSDDLDAQEVNCLVIWTRPPPPIIALIQKLQNRIASLVGPDLHIIRTGDLHLSVIELSHRHSVAQLRSVTDEVGIARIQKILDLISTLASKPKLGLPQLNFDKMGIALNFLPLNEPPYTYHHLRSDMHALALESGVSIDMCYTAPSAHVTLGRFVGNAFFDSKGAREEFVKVVQGVNDELRRLSESDDGLKWVVGESASLELQLGYLKFGREREKAGLLGRA